MISLHYKTYIYHRLPHPFNKKKLKISSLSLPRVYHPPSSTTTNRAKKKRKRKTRATEKNRQPQRIFSLSPGRQRLSASSPPPPASAAVPLPPAGAPFLLPRPARVSQPTPLPLPWACRIWMREISEAMARSSKGDSGASSALPLPSRRRSLRPSSRPPPVASFAVGGCQWGGAVADKGDVEAQGSERRRIVGTTSQRSTRAPIESRGHVVVLWRTSQVTLVVLACNRIHERTSPLRSTTSLSESKVRSVSSIPVHAPFNPPSLTIYPTPSVDWKSSRCLIRCIQSPSLTTHTPLIGNVAGLIGEEWSTQHVSPSLKTW